MKKNDPLVSVIIPAYNAEKFLKTSVSSVLKQTYKNIELIIVNDGSVDGTSEVAGEYAKKHKNVLVVTKKNGGLGYARNTGNEHAKGDYIYYLDADDAITEHCIERLVDAAEKEGADVVCTMVVPDLKKEKLGKKSYVLSGIEALCQSLTMQLPTASWGRLYRKEVVKKVKFSKVRYAEDFEYNLRFFPVVDKVVVLDDYTYVYATTEGSMVNSPYNTKKAEIIPTILRLEEMSKDKQFSADVRKTMRSGCYLQSLAMLINLYETGIKQFSDNYRVLASVAKRNSVYAARNKNIDKRHRRFALCSIVSVRMTLKMICRAYSKAQKEN